MDKSKRSIDNKIINCLVYLTRNNKIEWEKDDEYCSTKINDCKLDIRPLVNSFGQIKKWLYVTSNKTNFLLFTIKDTEDLAVAAGEQIREKLKKQRLEKEVEQDTFKKEFLKKLTEGRKK